MTTTTTPTLPTRTYTCGTCGGAAVVGQVAAGLASETIACRTRGCPGVAIARRTNTEAPPAWEWYRPSEAELDRHDAATRAHVRGGWLLLRRL